jgi:hypothetical protein
LTASWRYLAMLNYEISLALLRPQWKVAANGCA